jgi:hypothetical protein
MVQRTSTQPCLPLIFRIHRLYPPILLGTSKTSVFSFVGFLVCRVLDESVGWEGSSPEADLSPKGRASKKEIMSWTDDAWKLSSPHAVLLCWHQVEFQSGT